MSKSCQGQSATGRGSKAINGRLLTATASVTAIGLLAGCHGSSASAAGSTAVTASPAGTAATAPTPSSTTAFVPVTEPFDPGHPARAVSAPANCGAQDTTLAMEQCFENKTETADAGIDAVRQASFANVTAAQQAASNAENSDWLAARKTVCEKAYQMGGTIDGINPSGHQVAPGTEYQFSIDYSHLRADPNAGKGSGGWVYAPGTPVAVWR